MRQTNISAHLSICPIALFTSSALPFIHPSFLSSIHSTIHPDNSSATAHRKRVPVRERARKRPLSGHSGRTQVKATCLCQHALCRYRREEGEAEPPSFFVIQLTRERWSNPGIPPKNELGNCNTVKNWKTVTLPILALNSQKKSF